MKILRCDRRLLAAAQPHCLIDHARGFGIEAVAVAIGADDGAGAHDRIAAFTDLIIAWVVGNFFGLIQSGLLM